jgi:hypothetical protein
MNEERRRHPRLVKPFEGTFSGASGSSRCRITDVGLGGCFVQSLAMPNAGEPIMVTVSIGNHQLSFNGAVAYIDRGMGFAVQFKDIPQDELDELARLLSLLTAELG